MATTQELLEQGIGFRTGTDPLTPSELTADSLTFPDEEVAETDTAFIASLRQQEQAEETITSPELEESRKERKTLIETLKAGLTRLTGRAGRLGEEERRLGITTQTEELMSLNLEIAQRTAEFDALVQQEANRPIPMGDIIGRQAQIRRQMVVEISGLNMQKQALIGNIQLAMSLAERTVSLEFAPLEQELKNVLTFLELNEEFLSEEEKKIAETIKSVNKQRQKELEEAKKDKRKVLGFMIEFPHAGVLTTDSFEDAAKKIARFEAAKPTDKELTTVQQAKVTAAITIYGDAMEDALLAGATPTEALRVAIELAFQSGLPIDLVTQEGLLQEARRLEAQKARPIESPIGEGELDLPDETAIGFFSKIFGFFRQ